MTFPSAHDVREQKIEHLKELRDKLKESGYSCVLSVKKSPPHIKIPKKRTGRIKITSTKSHYRNMNTGNWESHPVYECVFYAKSIYGGYKIDNSLDLRTDKTSNIVDLIHKLNAMPEMTSVEKKGGDTRETILQNIMGRMFKSKHENAHLYALANSEKEACKVRVVFVNIIIKNNSIDVSWPSLSCEMSRKISFEPSSPDFDPEKVVNTIIGLDKRLGQLQRGIAVESNRILESL